MAQRPLSSPLPLLSPVQPAAPAAAVESIRSLPPLTIASSVAGGRKVRTAMRADVVALVLLTCVHPSHRTLASNSQPMVTLCVPMPAELGERQSGGSGKGGCPKGRHTTAAPRGEARRMPAYCCSNAAASSPCCCRAACATAAGAARGALAGGT